MKPSILIALICLVQGASFAQDAPKPSPQFMAMLAQWQDLQARHTIHRQGADTSRAAKLEMLFAQAGPADDAAFTEFAAARYGATGKDAEVLKEARAPRSGANADVCAPILDDSLPDGMSVAKYLKRIHEEGEQAEVARYQGIINRLSPRVQANVEQRINEEVAGLSSADLDHIAMAQENPELYKTMTKSMCAAKKAAISSTPPDASSPNPDIGRAQR